MAERTEDELQAELDQLTALEQAAFERRDIVAATRHSARMAELRQELLDCRIAAMPITCLYCGAHLEPAPPPTTTTAWRATDDSACRPGPGHTPRDRKADVLGRQQSDPRPRPGR